MVTTALGITAAVWAILMAVSPLLQVKDVRRRGSSEGISTRYLGVLLVGFCMWIAYGAARHDLPLIVPNSVALAVMAFTIGVVVRNR